MFFCGEGGRKHFATWKEAVLIAGCTLWSPMRPSLIRILSTIIRIALYDERRLHIPHSVTPAFSALLSTVKFLLRHCQNCLVGATITNTFSDILLGPERLLLPPPFSQQAKSPPPLPSSSLSFLFPVGVIVIIVPPPPPPLFMPVCSFLSPRHEGHLVLQPRKPRGAKDSLFWLLCTSVVSFRVLFPGNSNWPTFSTVSYLGRGCSWTHLSLKSRPNIEHSVQYLPRQKSRYDKKQVCRFELYLQTTRAIFGPLFLPRSFLSE